MEPDDLRQLLSRVKEGRIEVDDAVETLRHLPFEDLGFARLDHHRALRRGLPEVIFGEGKTTDQLVAIAQAMVERQGRVLCTRVAEDAVSTLLETLPSAEHHTLAHAVTAGTAAAPPHATHGPIAVVTAGTSDLPIAEEAAVTLSFFGNEVLRITDVGVAGLQRVLAARPTLDRCAVSIVVAGMEGALPSVIGGLVRCPVVAVPTSVGYGASFQGLAALLGMLSSCASGITVVNIDNGFGAAYAATLMNRIGREAGAGG